MTPPLDRLRQIAAIRRELDDEENAIIDALTTTQPAAISGPARRPGRGKIVSIGVAEKITGMSRNWIYGLARKRPDIGWKTETAGWRFDETALRSVFDRPPCTINTMCTISADSEIPPSRKKPYLHTYENEGKMRHE